MRSLSTRFATDGGTTAAETRRGWHQLRILSNYTHGLLGFFSTVNRLTAFS